MERERDADLPMNAYDKMSRFFLFVVFSLVVVFDLTYQKDQVDSWSLQQWISCN